MSEQDHKPYGEREALEAWNEQGGRQHIERAITGVRTAIGHMDDDTRKEVLDQALAGMRSSLVVSKGDASKSSVREGANTARTSSD
jgi:hypothetical protein